MSWAGLPPAPEPAPEPVPGSGPLDDPSPDPDPEPVGVVALVVPVVLVVLALVVLVLVVLVLALVLALVLVLVLVGGLVTTGFDLASRSEAGVLLDLGVLSAAGLGLESRLLGSEMVGDGETSSLPLFWASLASWIALLFSS